MGPSDRRSLSALRPRPLVGPGTRGSGLVTDLLTSPSSTPCRQSRLLNRGSGPPTHTWPRADLSAELGTAWDGGPLITQPASHPWLHRCGVCGIHRMNAQPGKKQDCWLAPNRKHGQPAHSHGDTREKGGHLFGDTTLNKESRRAANHNTGRGCLDWQAIMQRQTWGLGRDIEVDHTWRLLPSWTSETRGLNQL